MEYIGIGIAFVSLVIAAYTALVPLSKINKNMSALGENMSALSENMSALSERMVSAEISSGTGLILSRISSVPWHIFELQTQQEAALCCDSESLVKRNSRGAYKLTSTGEQLLKPELRETIVAIRKSHPKINNKALILQLGVTKLVKEAQLRNVPPEAMVGTVITYLKT